MSPELFYPDCKVHGRNSVMLEDPDDDEDEEDVDNLSERDALNPAAAEAAALATAAAAPRTTLQQEQRYHGVSRCETMRWRAALRRGR